MLISSDFHVRLLHKLLLQRKNQLFGLLGSGNGFVENDLSLILKLDFSGSV